MKLALLSLLSALWLQAQTTYSLQVPPGAVNPGSVVTATVNISTVGVVKPVAVQLRLNYTAADIASVTASVVAASKSVSCNSPVAGILKCIVYTNSAPTPIADGVLLTYAITISPNTIKTNTSISLTDDKGSTVGGDVIQIADVPFVAIALVPSKCDLNVDGIVDASDVSLALDQALEKTPCAAGDLDKDGQCTVADVQRVINSVQGQGCRTN